MQPKILSVRFRSNKTAEELAQLSEASFGKFRAMREQGLIQKYYVTFESTGEVGGIYLFESQQAIDAYLRGPIYTTIAERFGAGDSLRHEILDVQYLLYPLVQPAQV